jgi:hypothetical protein
LQYAQIILIPRAAYFAVVGCGFHRAAHNMIMAAAAEAAFAKKWAKINKTGIKLFLWNIPCGVKRRKARRIDRDASPGKREQFHMARSVPPPSEMTAYLARGECHAGYKRVKQRAFSNAGVPREHNRFSGYRPRKRPYALTRYGACRKDREYIAVNTQKSIFVG